MEEKERFEYYFGTNTVKDNINKEFLSYKRVVDTLNKQDKRIKELEQENQKLKERIIELQEREESYINTMRYLNKIRSELLNLPKKIVEEIEEEIIKYDLLKNFPNEAGYCMFYNILDTILKKYGGGR